VRIASLLPSTTEIVCSIGLKDSLVAITHECDYPLEVQKIDQVTKNAFDDSGKSSAEIDRHIRAAVHQGSSLYTLDQEALKRLRPELILTQELCKVCAVSYEQVSAMITLIDGSVTVVSLEPKTLQQIFESIVQVGRLTDREEVAVSLVRNLTKRVSQIQEAAMGSGLRPRVLCLEWLDPPMVAGHWVPDMVRLAGGTDVLGQSGGPSYRISWAALTEARPDFIIAMPCGYHLEDTVREFQAVSWPTEWASLAAVQNKKVFAVDGSSHFSRPGPRIVDGIEVLFSILHASKPTAARTRSFYRRL
jgi:iron complex transport system substrate-binding protein